MSRRNPTPVEAAVLKVACVRPYVRRETVASAEEIADRVAEAREQVRLKLGLPEDWDAAE